MKMNRTQLASLSLAAVMAAGSACFAQAEPRPLPNPGQGPVPPAPVPPQNAPDRTADRPMVPPAPQAEADRQVREQLDKIQQRSDNLTTDRLCVLNLAMGGHFEVEYAKQAQQKSQDANVKKIAKRLVEDHQQANQRLMMVAQKLQVEPPTGLTSMKQKVLDILGSLDSKTYDQTFLAMNDAHHAQTVTALRNESQSAKSPELRQFAAQTLPTLQEHWQMIKQTQTAMGGADADAQPAAGKVQGVTPGNDPANLPPARPNAGRPQDGQNAPSPTPRQDNTGPVIVPPGSVEKTNSPDKRPDSSRPPSGQNTPGNNNTNK